MLIMKYINNFFCSSTYIFTQIVADEHCAVSVAMSCIYGTIYSATALRIHPSGSMSIPNKTTPNIQPIPAFNPLLHLYHRE